MKKTIAVLVILLSPIFLMAQTYNAPKMIAEEFMSGTKKGLGTITKGATHYAEPVAIYIPTYAGTKFIRPELYFPQASSVVTQATASFQPTILRAVANQAKSSVAQILPTVQLATIARLSTPIPTFLQGMDEVTRLLLTDTSYEFFEQSTVKEGIISTRAKKDIDVADLQAQTFYTIAKGDVVEFSQRSIEALSKQYAQTHETTVLRTKENLQAAARNATGERNFLFPAEFIQLIEEGAAPANEFFASSLVGRKIASSTHTSFLPVKQNITVLTVNGPRFIKAGTFLDVTQVRLGEIEKAITPFYNVEFDEKDLQPFLQNSRGIPGLVSRPGTYTDKFGTQHQIVRLQAPLEIADRGTVAKGTYLDVATPGKITIFDVNLLQNSSR